jgi:hypothetical protein
MSRAAAILTVKLRRRVYRLCARAGPLTFDGPGFDEASSSGADWLVGHFGSIPTTVWVQPTLFAEQ